MTIWEETRRVYEELREIRHALHRHPELGHREIWTTQAIRGWLEQWEGIQVLDYGFPTGLAARIQGGRPGGLLALREDIDALPIQERTGLPFASECPGVSHACGHDIHTAALLGCAKLLARRRGDLQGSVLLIFQCAEETFDGAAAMLEQGLFREQVPDAVVGFHCAPALPGGPVGLGGEHLGRRPAQLGGQLAGQILVGNAANAVCSKQSSHSRTILLCSILFSAHFYEDTALPQPSSRVS